MQMTDEITWALWGVLMDLYLEDQTIENSYDFPQF